MSGRAFATALRDPWTLVGLAGVAFALVFAVILTAICIGLFRYVLRLPIPVVTFL